MPSCSIRLGADGIEFRQETGIALRNEERRRRAPDRRILTRDIAECVLDRRGHSCGSLRGQRLLCHCYSL
ncbi:MAG: hypothetical protein CAF42_007935 [Nitrospira sp. CG24B]|nr:MAG: hypothetical protein CAF42_007935 [Nitrospira sp. CG24B]